MDGRPCGVDVSNSENGRGVGQLRHPQHYTVLVEAGAEHAAKAILRQAPKESRRQAQLADSLSHVERPAARLPAEAAVRSPIRTRSTLGRPGTSRVPAP